MTRAYTDEFPEFDYALPVIPGFEDTSWHNDVCPSLTRADPDGDESRNLILWCDYADRAMREHPKANRFCLIRGEYAEIATQAVLYEGEDLDMALAAIAREIARA